MDASLLLDQNYRAMAMLSWRKVIKLLVVGKAEAIDGSTIIKSVRSVDKIFNIPSTIRLTVPTPFLFHSKEIRFSRKNVLLRDKSTCQYCGKIIGHSATVDHIMPKSRGGTSSFFNCVASCMRCNSKKRDRTLKESGMRLIRMPKKPTFVDLYSGFFQHPLPEWFTFVEGLKK